MNAKTIIKNTLLASIVTIVSLTSAASQEKLKDIRIGITSKSPIYAPLYYAKRAGLFDKAGLKVEIVDAGGGTKVAAGLAGGSFQATLSAIDHFFAAASHGQDWVLLGQTLDKEPYTYAMTKDLAAQKGITPESPLADRIKSLDGLTMGISSLGSGTQIALASAMESVGLNPAKAKWVPIGDPLAIVSALQQGQIDVGGRAPGAAEMAVSRGVATMVLDFSRDQVGQAYPTIVVVSTKAMLGKYRPELQALMDGLNQGLKKMHEHPEEVASLIRPDFAAMDDNSFKAGIEFTLRSLPGSVAISPEQYQRSVEHNNEGFALKIRNGQKITTSFKDAVDGASGTQ